MFDLNCQQDNALNVVSCEGESIDSPERSQLLCIFVLATMGSGSTRRFYS